jgi:hypothetical protein
MRHSHPLRSGRARPRGARTVVVLPAPFGERVHDLSCRDGKLSRSTAGVARNCSVSSRTMMAGGPSLVPGLPTLVGPLSAGRRVEAPRLSSFPSSGLALVDLILEDCVDVLEKVDDGRQIGRLQGEHLRLVARPQRPGGNGAYGSGARAASSCPVVTAGVSGFVRGAWGASPTKSFASADKRCPEGMW